MIVLTLFALAIAAFCGIMAVMERKRHATTKAAFTHLQKSCAELQEGHTALDANREREYRFHSQQLTDLHRVINRLHGQVFRIPRGKNVRELDTPIGRFVICRSRGYFCDSAIFVYFPIGFGFSQEIADVVRKETEGRFIMDPAPGSSSGGDNAADAIITAGLDHQAFLEGKQGYFKESFPPDLDEMADILTRVIKYPVGVTE